MRRVIAFFLVLVISCGIVSGLTACSTVVSAEDANMTKGEWMLLFASETGIYATDYNTETAITKDDKFYEAVNAVIEFELLTTEEASINLEKAVTKETVAKTCVNFLYFRKTYEVEFKDERKIEDVQIAADAVGSGIVKDENGYFKPTKSMTYDECQNAIDVTINIDASGTFEEDESKIDFEYQPNVVDLSDLKDSDFEIFLPNSKNYNTIASSFVNSDSSELSYTENAVSNNKLPECKPGALSNSELTVRPKQMDVALCSKPQEITNKIITKKSFCSSNNMGVGDAFYLTIGILGANRSFQVGQILTWQDSKLMDLKLGSDLSQYGLKPSWAGRIIEINSSSYGQKTLKCVVPTPEELVAKFGMNKTTLKKGFKYEPVNESKPDGVSVGPFSYNNGALSFTLTDTLENATTSWRQQKFKGDLKYTFTLSDLKLTVDGFGNVFKDEDFVNNKAIIRLDYKLKHNFVLDSGVRYAPDNNRNGKFVSNFSRSRFTSGAGAKDIKIARLKIPIGNTPIVLEFYIYLKIRADGQINITVSQDCKKGVKFVDKRPVSIKEKKPDKKIDIQANIEASVHCRGSIALDYFIGAANIADFDFGAGIGAACAAQIYQKDNPEQTIDSGKAPVDYLNSFLEQETKYGYCIDISFYWFAELSMLTENCLLGKAVRKTNNKFDGQLWSTKENIVPPWHFENGAKVDQCSRKGADQTGSSATVNGENFTIDTFKIFVVPYTCALVFLTEIPIDIEYIRKNMGGINVYSKNTDIADVIYNEGNLIISVVWKTAGITEIVIESKNKRFIQQCSVVCNEV